MYFKEIIFLSVLVVICASNDVAIDAFIKEQFLAVVTRGRVIKDISDEGSVPENEVTTNPVKITDNPLLTQLCSSNLPGDYQNPFNCNQFFMCTNDGSVYLAKCPANGAYNPLSDECVYHESPGAQCPWKSTWYYPDRVNCETLGERPWWGLLTFPAEPEARCCQNIILCHNYTQEGTRECSPGYGYSKGYLGCLPLDKCNEADDYFGL